MLTINQIP